MRLSPQPGGLEGFLTAREHLDSHDQALAELPDASKGGADRDLGVVPTSLRDTPEDDPIVSVHDLLDPQRHRGPRLPPLLDGPLDALTAPVGLRVRIPRVLDPIDRGV